MSVALVVCCLTAIQWVTLVASFEKAGPLPALFHALVEVPLGAFFLVWYIVGTILAGLVVSVFGDAGLGFFSRLRTQSPLPFYALAAVFFGAFNALVFFPLASYLRTRSSAWLYLFAVLIALYGSFVFALLL